MNNVNITRAAGWIAIAGSAFHLVATPLSRGSAWSEVFSQGWWNTVTLEPTPERLPVAEAFWLTPGSFAAPLLLFGALVVWSANQGHRVPAAFGWGMAAWGVAAVSLLPASPGWIFPLIGGLIIAGDRQRTRTRPKVSA